MLHAKQFVRVGARPHGGRPGNRGECGGSRSRPCAGPAASADAATAAPVPPAFASPFPCGQVWFARTYAGHPSNAVDWNLPGSGEADFGRPVLAGAAGVVTVAEKAGYGLLITIDHGNGWSTLYGHLSAVAVATGDPVSAATLVGAVGRSGHADGSHLHEEQIFNGVRQPIVIDGHPVDATFSSRGVSYTSANCPPPARRWRTRWHFAPKTTVPPAVPAPDQSSEFAATPQRLGLM